MPNLNNKQFRYDMMYIDIATRVSEMSIDHKHKVGCVIVKDGVVAEGWNGAPTGFPNETRDEDGKTLPYIIHAEQNAIAKCARKGVACEGATLYVTLSPCRDCARLLIQSGIKRVVYRTRFSDTTGVEMLEKAGIELTHLKG